MSKKVREIVSPTIQRGSYCCHSETILQALLCSQDEEDRRFAVKQIRDIRERLDEPEIGDKQASASIFWPVRSSS